MFWLNSVTDQEAQEQTGRRHKDERESYHNQTIQVNIMTRKTVLKIGVTGSAGSGKSLVVKGFAELGLVTLDCDRIARQVVAPGRKGFDGVVTLFGPQVLTPENRLDRALLRQLILAHPDKRRQLEALLHPLIFDALFHQIATAEYGREKACAIEVPLLFETGMERAFDTVVTVYAPDRTLVERVSARDNVSRRDARNILSLQMPQKEKMARSDYVLHNHGTSKALFESVAALYGKIKKRA